MSELKFVLCRKCKKTLPVDYFTPSYIYSTGKGDCTECLRKTKGLKSINYKRSYEGFIICTYKNLMGFCKYRNIPLPTFSLKKFKIWIKNQNYDELYEEWRQHRFDSYFKPSIDRKNNLENYTIKNIQLITWKENLEKSHIEQKWKVGKPVYQIFKGEIIAKYCSIIEAGRQTGIDPSGIAKACKQKLITAGDYSWSYAIRGWKK
jgi:hypothetical protein